MLVSAESGLLASDGICADLVAVELGALRRDAVELEGWMAAVVSDGPRAGVL